MSFFTPDILWSKNETTVDITREFAKNKKMIQILKNMMSSLVFRKLRTEHKLGYIVGLQDNVKYSGIYGPFYFSVVVQSKSSNSPEFIEDIIYTYMTENIFEDINWNDLPLVKNAIKDKELEIVNSYHDKNVWEYVDSVMEDIQKNEFSIAAVNETNWKSGTIWSYDDTLLDEITEQDLKILFEKTFQTEQKVLVGWMRGNENSEDIYMGENLVNCTVIENDWLENNSIMATGHLTNMSNPDKESFWIEPQANQNC